MAYWKHTQREDFIPRLGDMSLTEISIVFVQIGRDGIFLKLTDVRTA